MLMGLVRAVFFLATLGLSAGAILAVFGFIEPLLDAFNHFQPLWFAGTLICLLLTGVFFRRQRSRALMIALSATGFLTSGIIVVPEIISGYLPRPAAPADAETYRLMTYNVFGLNYDMQGVAAMIASEDPDIVAINEYFPEQRGPLHELLKPDYPFSRLCSGGKRANIAIYARMPFIGAEPGGDPCNHDFDDRTSILTLSFSPPGSPGFTVVATQLDWPIQISPLREGGDLLNRIALMSARQRGQFARIAAEIGRIEDNVILVGDFNATPWSYALRCFARDNGLVRETRNLPTFPKLWHFDAWRETPAFLPLDHVLTRGNVRVTSVHTGNAAGSDHLPVIADFSVVR